MILSNNFCYCANVLFSFAGSNHTCVLMKQCVCILIYGGYACVFCPTYMHKLVVFSVEQFCFCMLIMLSFSVYPCFYWVIVHLFSCLHEKVLECKLIHNVQIEVNQVFMWVYMFGSRGLVCLRIQHWIFRRKKEEKN